MSVSDRFIVFTREFRWSPPEKPRQVTIVYPAGWAGIVRKACAAAAIAAGAGRKPKPKETSYEPHR